MDAELPPLTEEPISFDLLRDLVGAEACTVLDIGANNGWHSARFARTFPQATVHAFEPDARAIAKFRKNVKNSRVVLHEIAIANEDGSATFHVSSGLPPHFSPEDKAKYPQGWDQSGSLRAPKNHLKLWPWCRFDALVTVPVRALDSWARDHGVDAVDLIWADIQGAAGDMIQGGHETLSRTRYLFTEYSNEEYYEGEPDLPTLLAMLPGFSVMKRYRWDVLLRNDAYLGGN